MCSRVGTGQRLSQRIEYWIEYDGNHPNEQGNATDVVMGGRGDGWCAHQLDDNEKTMDWFILAYVGISTNGETFVAL